LLLLRVISIQMVLIYIYIICFCRLFLILSYFFLFSDKKTIIPSNPPPPLPLQPPPSLNQSLNTSNNNKNTFTIVKNNLNHHRHTIIFVTNNNTNINDQNLNNFLNTSIKNNNNNSLIGESSNIKITPLVICAPSLTQTAHSFYNKSHQCYAQHHYNQSTDQNTIINPTPTTTNNNQINSKTNEPIIYIDSIDELENYSISSSISSLSSISSPDKSSQSDSYTIDMNQLLARLKQTTKNLTHIQNNNKNLTPSNSVESFEFIADSTTTSTAAANKNTCYEQSWHTNQASQILDQITNDKVFTNSSLFLASSLIEIANKQQQQQQQVTNDDNNMLRYRKYKSSVPAVRRISFPIQKLPSFNEFEKLTPIPSSSRIIYNSK